MTTFTVLIYFKQVYIRASSLNADKVWAFYNSNHPVACKSGGSVVAMKDSDYWRDYYDVNNNEIHDLIQYIDHMDDKELKDNMYIQIQTYTPLEKPKRGRPRKPLL